MLFPITTSCVETPARLYELRVIGPLSAPEKRGLASPGDQGLDVIRLA